MRILRVCANKLVARRPLATWSPFLWKVQIFGEMLNACQLVIESPPTVALCQGARVLIYVKLIEHWQMLKLTKPGWAQSPQPGGD